MKLILSHKVLVVEGVEISAFPLVWEFGWVADQVAVGVVPSMQEVTWNSRLVIKDVSENVVGLVAFR